MSNKSNRKSEIEKQLKNGLQRRELLVKMELKQSIQKSKEVKVWKAEEMELRNEGD